MGGEESGAGITTFLKCLDTVTISIFGMNTSTEVDTLTQPINTCDLYTRVPFYQLLFLDRLPSLDQQDAHPTINLLVIISLQISWHHG